ncbi:hypothetical protein B0H13DRAFT_1669670, partial [Mycena leptocephala]
HRVEAGCTCIPCTEDSAINGCKNPHKCVLAARERLGLLIPKWDPRANETEQVEVPEGGITCFKAPEQIKSLAEGFRVFTKQNDDDPLEDAQGATVVPEDTPDLKLCVHIQTRTTKSDGVPQAGGGAWWGEDDPRNISIRLPKS